MSCSYSRLEILSTIEEIRGPLYIVGYPESTFPYLRNLRVIGSDDTNDTLFTHCGSAGGKCIAVIFT